MIPADTNHPHGPADDDVALYFRLSLANRNADVAAGEPAGGANEDRIDVLIVDDQFETVEPVLLALRKWGRRAECVSSAAAALESLDVRRPRLILLDISMPQMDGIELLAALRARWAAGGELPVAMLTADPMRSEEAQRLGARDYIVKPLDFTFLRARIDRLMNPGSWGNKASRPAAGGGGGARQG